MHCGPTGRVEQASRALVEILGKQGRIDMSFQLLCIVYNVFKRLARKKAPLRWGLDIELDLVYFNVYLCDSYGKLL